MKGNDANTRSALELADVFRKGIEAYSQDNRLSEEQSKAARDIASCRTKEFGGHIKECTNCGFAQQAYNSCRNRHCPKCQFARQEQWADKLRGNLIPGKYYHIVFTLPQELHSLFLYNTRECYALLFKASSQALLRAGSNPGFLGAQTGALAILHTWTQALCYHPHIHMLVPAGGLSEDGMEWKASKKKFFLPAKVLSRIYRGSMTKLLKEGLDSGSIKLPDTIKNFSELKKQLYKNDWNVYLKKAFGGVGSVLKYLARYTHRVAISNSRLVSASGGKVSFWYKDNKCNGKIKLMTLDNAEFIRRFLLHVLPRNFYKIRYIGILASINSKTKKAQCVALIGVDLYLPALEGLSSIEAIEAILKIDTSLCPKCRKGRMSNNIIGAG